MSSVATLHYGNSSEFREWDPSSLKNISPSEVQFKNAFESLEINSIKSSLNGILKSYFEQFDLNDLAISVACNIGVTEYISRAFSFSYINSGGAVVLSEHAVNYIRTYFSNDSAVSSDSENQLTLSELALEYFVMKLLGTLCKSVSNVSCDKVVYTGETSSFDLQDYAGEVFYLTFDFRSNSFSVEFILPYELVSCLSSTVSEISPYKSFTKEDLQHLVEPVRYSMPLFTFEVPPSELIDYLQAEAIIILEESSLHKETPVFINQNREASGHIMRCQGNYLVCYMENGNEGETRKDKNIQPSFTKVQVVLIDERTDPVDLSMSPKCYKTRTAISSMVYLEISGEVVAKGMLGYINDKLSVKVLPN